MIEVENLGDKKRVTVSYPTLKGLVEKETKPYLEEDDVIVSITLNGHNNMIVETQKKIK